MGKEGSGVRREMQVDAQALPPQWREPVKRFLSRVDAAFGLDCAILYGSMATGNYNEGSDIDLVLISEGAPSDFWQRLKAVAEFYEARVPIEALTYTRQELHQMIEDMHVTALDATVQGIPLTGLEVFEELRGHTAILQSKGLRRTDHAWVMDAPGCGANGSHWT